MAEYRVFGPPGTGKTTYLAHQIQRALAKYDPQDVVVCSFTRAAAAEIAGRDVGLPAENIGTIHALCYHALGRPEIVETKPELLEEWNARNPDWQVGREKDALDEPPAHPGELLRWNVVRSRTGRCPADIFGTPWERFKQEHGVVDFTDLLLQAPDSIRARVLMVDEAQDLTPLQWRIVRRWGAGAETFVVAGDDDQLLYSFLGADAETFLAPIPDEQKRVLGQSHRLPRTICEAANRWVRKLGQAREPKDYAPRDADGEVALRGGLSFENPGGLVAEVADRAAAGQTVMVLASCGYMLAPVLAELRAAGVPYHNPYREKRGDWNPLRTVGGRILDFLACCRQTDRGAPPPAEYWWPWMEMLRASETLQRGGKEAMRRLFNEGAGVTEADLEGMLTEPLIGAMVAEDVAWLREHATDKFQKALEYPAAIYGAAGERGLRDAPRVVVGTIHSVKGGEADVVYLSPEISYQASEALAREPVHARWALVRQFYVGMTRAREALCLCGHSTDRYVNWN